MDPANVTVLLGRVERGDRQAAAELYEIAYAELRERAGRLLGREAGGTLQATVLVHEAWLRLNDGAERGLKSRAHFLGVAAKAMRSVLVDHVRAKGAEKRGGRRERLLLDEGLAIYEERALDVVALNEVLDRLARLDERLARIVELRFFGGLSIEETAEVLGVGHATVERGWTAARAWLRGHLRDGGVDGP